MKKFERIYSEIEQMIGEGYNYYTFYSNGRFSIVYCQYRNNTDYSLYFLSNGEKIFSIASVDAERFINSKIQYLNWKNGR